MRYNVDETGCIANWALVGDVGNGMDFDGALPEDFPAHSAAYRVVGGALVLDAEKAAALDAAVEAATEIMLDDVIEYMTDIDLRLTLQEMGL